MKEQTPEWIEGCVRAIEQVPLNISSTRRGVNGLRNAEELAKAFVRAMPDGKLVTENYMQLKKWVEED